MRGSDERSGSLFSHIDIEGRVPRKSSAAADSRAGERHATGIRRRVRAALFVTGATVDSAGAVAAGQPVAVAVLTRSAPSGS
jgi:hypothetical protein